MSPCFLRYRFPSDYGSDSPATPEEHARALAHLFSTVPAHELSIGRLDAISGQWSHDPGTLDVAFGDAAGEELSAWLRLIVGPGGRIAYLDIHLEELANAVIRGKQEYREALRL